VVCHNPLEAERQRKHRELVTTELDAELESLRASDEGEHSKHVCELRASGRYGCFVRLGKSGKPTNDTARAKAAERLDGKFVVHSNDDALSAADPALGYKQLERAEQAWRRLKSGLRLIEKHIREKALTGEAKRDVRIEHARPGVDVFFELCDGQCQRLERRSILGHGALQVDWRHLEMPYLLPQLNTPAACTMSRAPAAGGFLPSPPDSGTNACEAPLSIRHGRPRGLMSVLETAVEYLAANERRAHPKRDRKTGRLQLGLEPVRSSA